MTGNDTNLLYRLLTGSDDTEFCHKITRALNEGWSLYGSPAVSFNEKTGTTVCAQAVTRQTSEPYDPERRLGDY